MGIIYTLEEIIIMRIYLVFVVLLFSNLILSAQFAWEELAPHNFEDIQVIHMTKNNRLIGYLRYGTALYASDDLGDSWKLLAHMDVLAEGNYDRDYDAQIAESPDGTLYTIIHRSIYEINEVDKLVEVFLEPDTFFPPTDLFFLPDERVVVYTYHDLKLYDSTGTFIKSVEIEDRDLDSRLLAGTGDTHYLYDDEKLTVFDSDFTLVEETIFEFENLRNRKIVINPEGRLYTNDAHSSDGKTWFSYPNGISGMPTITGQGRLHLLSRDSVFISQDEGESFDSYSNDGLNAYSKTGYSFAYDSTGIIFTYHNCSGYIKRSDSGIHSWVDNSSALEVGNPFAEYVEAVNEGFVVTRDCEGDPLGTYSEEWESLPQFGTEECHSLNHVLSFPDGSLFSNEGCRSTDNGISWLPSLDVYDPELVINASGSYILGRQVIVSSYDFGESWEVTPFIDLPNTFPVPALISSTKQVYSLGELLDRNVYRYSFDGDLVSKISPAGDYFIYMAASYNSPTIFLLSETYSGEATLMVYDEEDRKVETKSLPGEVNQFSRLYTDHGDNVYLLAMDRLYLSSDHGDNWQDITPDLPNFKQIRDIDFSWDGYIYLATLGTPILKSTEKVAGSVRSVELPEPQFSLYPNPAHDYITVNQESNLPLRACEIYNLSGQLILQQALIEDNTISLQSLDSGLYIFNLSFENGARHREKVVVVR